MLRKIPVLAIGLACFSHAFSQDSTKKSNLGISGSIDAYYRYNFDNAKDVGETNNYTSFTNSQNSFEIGMASVKLDHTIGKVEGVVDLGFGTRAEEFSYNDANTRFAVKQAYLSFKASDKIKLTMGKWATHVGYELLDAYLNRNYSMDYLFSYGPFSHTGLKAEGSFGNVGVMLGVVNPTDEVSAPFDKKFIIGQFSVASKDGKVSAYLNYVGGKNAAKVSSSQVDLVVTGTVTDKFSIGANGSVKSVKPDGGSSNSWYGGALYFNLDPTPVFGLTLRGEYFDDSKGVAGIPYPTGVDGTSIFDVTLSGNIRIDNLTIIPEFRLDDAKDAIFYKNSGETMKSTGTFILGATYHF